MTARDDLDCRYVVVPRPRGQRLKDVALLDPWRRDGRPAMRIRFATGNEGKEKPGTFGKNDNCFRFGPKKAAGAGLPGPLRDWVCL